MSTVSLCPMTREMCHEFYKEFQEELEMVAVKADAVLKNTRSQHVMEKVGFRYIREDETFKYYRCEKAHGNQEN